MKGYKRRVKACELAATLLHGADDPAICPRLWSACVFFEEYLLKGANGTAKEFGPKKPSKLKVVGRSRA